MLTLAVISKDGTSQMLTRGALLAYPNMDLHQCDWSLSMILLFLDATFREKPGIARLLVLEGHKYVQNLATAGKGAAQIVTAGMNFFALPKS